MSKDLPVTRGTRRPYRSYERRLEAIQEQFNREPTGNELRALKELPLSAKLHLYDTSSRGKRIYWLLQESENSKAGALEEAGKLLWEQIMSPPDFSRPSLTPVSKPFNSLPPPGIRNAAQTSQHIPSGHHQNSGLPFDRKENLAVHTPKLMVDRQYYSSPYSNPHLHSAAERSFYSQIPAQPTANPSILSHLPSYNPNSMQIPGPTQPQNPPGSPQTLNVHQKLTLHPTSQVISAQQRTTFVCQGKAPTLNLQNTPYSSQPEVQQLNQNREMGSQKAIPQVIIPLPRKTHTSASLLETPINITSSVSSPYQRHSLANTSNPEMTMISQHQSQIPAHATPTIRRPSSPFKRSFDPPTSNVQAADSHRTSSAVVPLTSAALGKEYTGVGNGQGRVPCEEDDGVAKRRRI
ncbi:hypothetical protein ACMFMG_001417 [Clarireedia jacksonii]